MKITTRNNQNNEHRARTRQPKGQSEDGKSQFQYYRSVNRSSPAAGGKNDSDARKRTKPKSPKWLAVVLLVIIIAILAIEAPVSFDSKINIDEPSSTTWGVPNEQLEAKAEQIMGSSVFNHIKYTFDDNQVENRLTEAFPQIKNVSVNFSLFSYRPTLDVVLREPVLSVSTEFGQYLVDQRGVAIGKLATGKSKVNLPVIKDSSSLEPELGKALLPQLYTKFISDLVYQLRLGGKNISTMELKEHTGQLDVHFSGQKYYVKFNIQGDASQQAGSFMASSEYLSKHGVHPKHYLDVRVAGRAYYK